MDPTMSHRTREEVLNQLRRRCLNAGAEHKRKLLDQAQELLGYHRKSAIRALRAPHSREPVGGGQSGLAGSRYGGAVRGKRGRGICVNGRWGGSRDNVG